jgi:hypothetical protein
MAIVKSSAVLDSATANAIGRMSYRSSTEIKIRQVLEDWCRKRWPNARLINELVVFRGEARADMAAVEETNLVAFEIKGPNDDTKRLIHQCGMFRLSAPELWVIAAAPHCDDALLMNYLIPSIGIACINGLPHSRWDDEAVRELTVEVLAEPTTFRPHGFSLLSVLWVDELRNQCKRHRLADKGVHAKLVERLNTTLTDEEKIEAVCYELRRRNFVFRSDAPQFKADDPQ